MLPMIQILGLPFLACVLMSSILGYLGTHVLKREVIFIDIALAQIAAVGSIAAHMVFEAHGDSTTVYLCSFVCVLLAAGLKGIEDKLKPPAPVERNIYALTDKEKEKYGIHHLPESLGHALSLMEESKLLKETLGDHIFDNFLHVKSKEWEDYRTQVTPWETDKYLPIL